MDLEKFLLSLIAGIFTSAIYGIFLSHREEGIRRFSHSSFEVGIQLHRERDNQ